MWGETVHRLFNKIIQKSIMYIVNFAIISQKKLGQGVTVTVQCGSVGGGGEERVCERDTEGVCERERERSQQLFQKVIFLLYE